MFFMFDISCLPTPQLITSVFMTKWCPVFVRFPSPDRRGEDLACVESGVQGMICYEMFSSILGWSCQLYVALEFCSVLHITYYTAVLQQLYCIVLQVLLGSSTHQDSSPHSDTLIASSLRANKYY